MKKKVFFSILAVFTAITVYAQQAAVNTISVKSNNFTYLYGAAAKREGAVSRQNGDFMRFRGPGTLEWKVNVALSGVYEININQGIKGTAAGKQVGITVGKTTINHTLAQTNGVFGPGSYECRLLNGSFKLDTGVQVITLTIPASAGDFTGFDFRSLELIPQKVKKTLVAEQEKAKKSRAKTDWMPKAKYGLMFHWTSQSVNKDGSKKPYAQAVADFDLNSYVNMVEATGAGYVIFTIGHAEAYCPAPLTSWEKYHPGHTTKRDLIAEMSDALAAKGIKLMCYFPTHILAKTGKATSAEFTQINTEVMTEFGKRYGKKVAGYWFDGWYQSFEKYPDFSFKDFFQVCKAGNPDRVTAFNSWYYPSLTEWQEYWAGETSNPVELPVNGLVNSGSGKGLRYQSLLTMEFYWVQERATSPNPKFTVEKLSDYIRQSAQNGGCVTVNIGIYQDGTIGEKALEVMKGVKKEIRL